MLFLAWARGAQMKDLLNLHHQDMRKDRDSRKLLFLLLFFLFLPPDFYTGLKGLWHWVLVGIILYWFRGMFFWPFLWTKVENSKSVKITHLFINLISWKCKCLKNASSQKNIFTFQEIKALNMFYLILHFSSLIFKATFLYS